MSLSRSKKIVLTLALFSAPFITTAATVTATDLLAGTLAKSDTIKWTNKTVYTKLVRFKKAVKVLGTLTVNKLHVTGVPTFDTAISADMVDPIDTDHTTNVTTDTITSGFVKYKEISGDDLQALLDGTPNTVMTFNENDMVLDVILTTTGAGTAATIDIGTDENWANGTEADTTEVDAFIADHDLTGAAISRMTVLDEANQTTVVRSVNVTQTTGDMIIQSSSDLTANTIFDGTLFVEYVSL